ncbi:MAG: rod shape-determining protein [Acidobacteria bacterium]|nr:rod shape-determining protein [Acidobacteriota bacterium]
MIKLAAIDIGSNAVRLMLSSVYDNNGETVYVKESLVRVPIRLGEDVFTHQRITSAKADQLATVIRAFSLIIKAYKAQDSIACATSAMREARNGKEIADRIRREIGVDIEIIEGRREAAIIYSSHISRAFRADKPMLYIDVGGGSAEVTLLSRNGIVESGSFKIGGVRFLKKGRSKEELARLKTWLKAKVAPFRPFAAVGTGGSINNIFRLSRKKEGKPISVKRIKELRDYLESFSVEERIKVLGLRPDRADVIVEAADIYLTVMQQSGVKKIFVPIMGLSDGLIHVLYQKVKSKHIDL